MKHCNLLILFSITLLCSCTHNYYIQNTQNIPLFKEKEEFSGLLAVGGGDEINKVDAQGAYSVTDDIGLMGTLMYAEDENNDESTEGGYGVYGDAAFGYFYPFNEYFVFETYVGFGYAEQVHKYSEYSGDSIVLTSANLSFLKLFLQPSIGLTTNYFDIAFSFRLSRLYFTEVAHNPFVGGPGQSYELAELNKIEQNREYYFWEPALTLRAGYKSMKFQIQAAHTLFLSSPDFNIADISLSLGVCIPIRKWNE